MHKPSKVATLISILIVSLSVYATSGRPLLFSIEDSIKFRSLGESANSGPVDFIALRAAEESSPTAMFRDGEKLLNAIALGHQSFETHESVNDTSKWNLTSSSDYNNMVNKALYETRILYTLDPPHISRYVNLDSISDVKSDIVEFSNNHMVHCNWDPSSSVSAFIVGSNRGAWATIPHINRVLEESLSRLHPVHAETKRKEGLLVVRRVTEIRNHDKDPRCAHLRTENIHPHELFANMRIESIGESPFQHSRDIKDNHANPAAPMSETAKESPAASMSESAKDRELLFDPVFFPPQDSKTAVKSCGYVPEWGSPKDFTIFGPNYLFHSDDDTVNQPAVNKNFKYELAVTNGCAELSEKLPGSFNFNYNPTTKRAQQSPLQIGGADNKITGITCSNCYAFVGAAFLVIVNYGRSAGYGIQFQIGGGVGYSLQLSILNPTLSGSSSSPLILPDADYTSICLDLKCFISLNYKNGGFIGSITGSGYATGKASLGGTTSLSAFVGAEIITSTTQTSSNIAPSFTATYSDPYFYGGFSSASLSAEVTITATEEFQVLIGKSAGISLSAQFNSNIATKLHISINYQAVSGSAEIVSSSSSSFRSLDKTSVVSYVPGYLIPVQFQYSNFNGNETTVLFYAISIDNGPEHQIMRYEFISDMSGNGTVDHEWSVPWNLFYTSRGPNNAVIVIRASNIVSTTYVTQPFGLTMFTSSDGIFSSPSIDEMIYTDSPYTLIWDYESLHYFETTAWQGYDGKNVTTEEVSFEIVCENVHTNGTVLSLSNYNNLVLSPVNNNGSVTVIFPTNLTATANRFYIIVHSVAKYDINGWSKGYFYLQPRPSPLAVKLKEKNIKLSRAAFPKKVSKVFISKNSPEAVVASNPRTGVKLQDTCVSKSSLGASATIGGSFESFSATLATFVTTIAVGANSIKTPLINDVTTCVTPLAPSFSPSAQPTSSPTSDPTSSAPTVSPSVHPTVLPSGTPTIAHFLSPSKQMTTSPIQQIVAIIAVTETFTNIDSTVASSLLFQAALKNSVASIFSMPVTVAIAGTLASGNGALRSRRSLQQSSATVSYTVTAVDSVSSSVLKSTLMTAISSGQLTKMIQSSSPTYSSVTADAVPSFVDASPTSSPTASPILVIQIATTTSDKPALSSTTVTIIAVVVVIFSVIATILRYLLWRRRRALQPSVVDIDNSSAGVAMTTVDVIPLSTLDEAPPAYLGTVPIEAAESVVSIDMTKETGVPMPMELQPVQLKIPVVSTPP